MKMLRRCPLLIAALLSTCVLAAPLRAAPAPRPNVVLIMTDDQGHGDLGFHGNPHIRTPNLDQLARESTRFTYFHVSPVCAPTRASLMTGRYNYRTCAIDTFLGRAMMHPDEVTLAEMLSQAGYRTGIFGKWHLGDSYPMRAMDQGFQETLVHRGGGIGQPSDPPGGDHYYDPTLLHNGRPVKTSGYCSDVYTDAALKFVESNRQQPFFAYLAFNAPHTPLETPTNFLARYEKMDLSWKNFPTNGHPLPRANNSETTAKIYAMVENIDANVGRVLERLDALNLATNTLVIFLTDNGPQQPRYNSGMLDRKGSVHDGGIRVPFFARWKGQLAAGRAVDHIAAHIDVAPTVLEACGVRKPARVRFDGRSLWPLMQGRPVDWPERTLYFQWHRGDVPELDRAFAARSPRYKLVQPLGVNAPLKQPPAFKLFDMVNDPLEMRDIAGQHPDIVAQMHAGYARWFQDVSSTRGFAPLRIHLGAAQENPVLLTRQDWRGPKAGWGPESIGYWEVRVAKAGVYDVKLIFAAQNQAASARLKLRGVELEQAVPANAKECVFPNVKLSRGDGRLEAHVTRADALGGVHYVEVTRREEDR